MRVCLTVAIPVAMIVASLAASAQPAPDRAARTWAASCAACHGTDGRTDARNPGSVPALAGRNADQLYQALVEFKNGQRPAATVMHQHTKGYTDDELRRIAQVFAAVK